MLHLLSHAEQVAAHLREELLRGRWQGEMPGVVKLEAELGVNHTTMNQALVLLEEEGLLVSQGDRKPRRIVLPSGAIPAGMSVAILLYESEDVSTENFIEMYHGLTDAGISVFMPRQTLTGMGMKVAKVARVVKATKADAWIVMSASGEVLEWFGKQQFPTLAYAGQFPKGMKVAAVAPGREKSMLDMLQRLVDLGHRRIVLLTGSGAKPRAFIQSLESHGITVGDYNLPTMERTPEGIRRCLNSLFSLTPPTALLIDEPILFLAIQGELARRGIFAPQDVSLISLDSDPAFKWHSPSVAHIQWELAPVNRRIIKWMIGVSRGKDDRKCVLTNSVFVDGGTIGPVPISTP